MSASIAVTTNVLLALSGLPIIHRANVLIIEEIHSVDPLLHPPCLPTHRRLPLRYQFLAERVRVVLSDDVLHASIVLLPITKQILSLMMTIMIWILLGMRQLMPTPLDLLDLNMEVSIRLSLGCQP